MEFGVVFSYLVLQAGSYDGRVSGPPPPICVITGTPGDRGLVHSKCVNMQIPFASGWGWLRGCISNDLPRDADAGLWTTLAPERLHSKSLLHLPWCQRLAGMLAHLMTWASTGS